MAVADGEPPMDSEGCSQAKGAGKGAMRGRVQRGNVGGQRRPPLKQHATKAQIFLNDQICRAATQRGMEGILNIAATSYAEMSIVNLATALHKLARCAKEGPRQPHFDPRFVVLRMRTSVQLEGHCANSSEGYSRCWSTIAWALATMHCQDGLTINIMTMIGRLSVNFINDFKAMELTNLLWSFAKIQVHSIALYEAARPLILNNFSAYTSSNLSTIVWAYATSNRQRFHGLQRLTAQAYAEALSNVKQVNPTEVANLLWGLATSQPKPHTQTILTVADVASRSLFIFKPQELTISCWAISKLGVRHDAFFMAVCRFLQTSANLRNQIHPQGIANLLWAFSRQLELGNAFAVELRATKVPLVPVCARLMSRLKPVELSSCLWALSKLGLRRGSCDGVDELLSMVVDLNDNFLSQLSLQSSINILGAFTRFCFAGREDALRLKCVDFQRRLACFCFSHLTQLRTVSETAILEAICDIRDPPDEIVSLANSTATVAAADIRNFQKNRLLRLRAAAVRCDPRTQEILFPALDERLAELGLDAADMDPDVDVDLASGDEWQSPLDDQQIQLDETEGQAPKEWEKGSPEQLKEQQQIDAGAGSSPRQYQEQQEEVNQRNAAWNHGVSVGGKNAWHSEAILADGKNNYRHQKSGHQGRGCGRGGRSSATHPQLGASYDGMGCHGGCTYSPSDCGGCSSCCGGGCGIAGGGGYGGSCRGGGGGGAVGSMCGDVGSFEGVGENCGGCCNNRAGVDNFGSFRGRMRSENDWGGCRCTDGSDASCGGFVGSFAATRALGQAPSQRQQRIQQQHIAGDVEDPSGRGGIQALHGKPTRGRGGGLVEGAVGGPPWYERGQTPCGGGKGATWRMGGAWEVNEEAWHQADYRAEHIWDGGQGGLGTWQQEALNGTFGAGSGQSWREVAEMFAALALTILPPAEEQASQTTQGASSSSQTRIPRASRNKDQERHAPREALLHSTLLRRGTNAPDECSSCSCLQKGVAAIANDSTIGYVVKKTFIELEEESSPQLLVANRFQSEPIRQKYGERVDFNFSKEELLAQSEVSEQDEMRFSSLREWKPFTHAENFQECMEEEEALQTLPQKGSSSGMLLARVSRSEEEDDNSMGEALFDGTAQKQGFAADADDAAIRYVVKKTFIEVEEEAGQSGLQLAASRFRSEPIPQLLGGRVDKTFAKEELLPQGEESEEEFEAPQNAQDRSRLVDRLLARASRSKPEALLHGTPQRQGVMVDANEATTRYVVKNTFIEAEEEAGQWGPQLGASRFHSEMPTRHRYGETVGLNILEEELFLQSGESDEELEVLVDADI